MRANHFILFLFVGLAYGSFFRDIFQGITKSGRFTHIVTDVPQNIISDLENDEAQAGRFICEILQGDVPTAITDLPKATWDEIEGDYSSLTNFVVSLPTIVPAVLDDIEQGGTVVVSIITELIQNPGGELTVLIDDVETVFDNVIGDIETVAGEIASGIECIFKDCAAATPTNTAQMNLVSNCQNVLAAATSTTTALTSPTPGGTSAPFATVTSTPLAVATSTVPAVTSTTSGVPNNLTATTSLRTSGSTFSSEASMSGWRQSATWVLGMALIKAIAF